MKQIIFTILTVLLTVTTFGQITTTKVTIKPEETDTKPYDSTQNFLGKQVIKYKGQELYLKGKAESLRKYGYEGFYTDFNKGKFDNGVYKCCDSYNSKYNELNGKYFKVLEIIKHPKSSENENLYGKKSYLKLEEKESKEIVYFEYDSQFEHKFEFIVVGFFEKIKKSIIGQEFVFADKILESSTDIETGKFITSRTGQDWKCIDLTIEEKYFNLSLIIQNSLGEKTTIYYESVFGKLSKGKVYLKTDADNYRKKFGSEKYDKILQGKVIIGMTKEMCKLSWGEPKKINETITTGKKTEQWVYSDNYLYFDNGILTVIQ